MFKLATSLTIAFCFLTFINAITIDIPAHGAECFFEHLETGDKLTVSYQVGEGGNLDIDFTINDPNGQPRKHTNKASSGHHSLVADIPGKYTYCFSNEMSTVSAKSINFNVHDMEHIQEAARSNIDPIEREIRELAESIFAIKDEQEYIVARERQHRDTAESTNARVKWWSIGQVALLVAVCFWQIFYLKRFFEVKRVV
ncbi:unnamed protein product [Cunninghamella blakesleeana]